MKIVKNNISDPTSTRGTVYLCISTLSIKTCVLYIGPLKAQIQIRNGVTTPPKSRFAALLVIAMLF